MADVICNKSRVCSHAKECLHGDVHVAKQITFSDKECTEYHKCREYMERKCIEVEVYGKSSNTGKLKYRLK